MRRHDCCCMAAARRRCCRICATPGTRRVWSWKDWRVGRGSKPQPAPPDRFENRSTRMDQVILRALIVLLVVINLGVAAWWAARAPAPAAPVAEAPAGVPRLQLLREAPRRALPPAAAPATVVLPAVASADTTPRNVSASARIRHQRPYVAHTNACNRRGCRRECVKSRMDRPAAGVCSAAAAVAPGSASPG